MKKYTLSLFLLLASLVFNLVNAAVIQVAAPVDLNVNSSTGVASQMSDGDIVELTTSGGVYNWSTRITTLTKSITIRAAAGLAEKPVIAMPSGVFIGTSNNSTPISLTFDGIDFIGNSLTTYFISAKSTSTGNVQVAINNCSFRDFPKTSSILYYSATGTNWTNSNYFSDLKVYNSEFDGMASLFVCSSNNATPGKLIISNCYFSNMGGPVLGTALYHVPAGVIMDHCTFNNCASATDKSELYIGYKSGVTTPAIITNTLFANRQGVSLRANVFGTAVEGFPNTNNAVYYTAGTLSVIYPLSLNYSVTSDPVIVDKVATGTDYLNASTDGSVIGYKGILKNAPVLSVDVTDNNVDHEIDLTFTSNTDWESLINSLYVEESKLLPIKDYDILPGIIRLKPSGNNIQLQSKGIKTIKILAKGYNPVEIHQYISAGEPAKLSIDVQPTAPETNGSTLIKQPIILIHDQYGNITSSTETVTASVGSGNWILGGAITVVANAGVATFSDLTATCSTDVNGATIHFSYGDLLGVTSDSFNISSDFTPTIIISKSVLNGFQYIYGNGPSISQSFTVNGLYIDSYIIITPADNFEISTDNINFVKTPLSISGTGTIKDIIIYARLIGGLDAGSYNSEVITLSSPGAIEKKISLNGSVFSPVITINTANLRSLGYIVDSEPSPVSFFTVFSSNLVGDVSLIASTNFELSLNLDGIFSNTISIPKDYSKTDVYVRLVSDLAVGEYSGNIIVSSPNVIASSVLVKGFVTKSVAYNELHNLPDPEADVAKVPRIRREEYTAWPVNHGDAHVTLWDDDKVAALSITIDDNHEDEHYLWLNLQKKYGFVSTWFVMTDRIGKPVNWASFQNVWDNGNDVQSHSVHHLDLKLPEARYPGIFDDEYAPSVSSINTNLVGGNCQTIGYPYAFGDYTVAKKYFIGGRGGVGQINWADNINYINTYATTQCDTFYVSALLNPNLKLYNKSHYGDWTVFTFHNIINIQPKVDSLMSYISERKDSIWVAWFRHVVKFGQERDSHTLTVTNVTDSKITFNLIDLMVDSLYDYPLTVKIRVNNDWNNVFATQNGNQLYTRMVTHHGNKYVLVKAVPDRGLVEVQNDMAQDLLSNRIDQIQINTSYNILTVSGVDKAEIIDIYNTLGQKCYSTKVTDDEMKIRLNKNTLYVVKIGRYVRKIKL